MWPCRQNCIRRDRFAQEGCSANCALSAQFTGPNALYWSTLCTNDPQCVQRLRILGDTGKPSTDGYQIPPGSGVRPVMHRDQTARVAAARPLALRSRFELARTWIGFRIGRLFAWDQCERTVGRRRRGARLGSTRFGKPALWTSTRCGDAALEMRWRGEGRRNRIWGAGFLRWHATCLMHPRHAARHDEDLIMRSLLTLIVAPLLVVAVVVCVLLLEPVRWCVVGARPWRRRTVVVRHVSIGPGQPVVS
jgi:hypothetical protein